MSTLNDHIEWSDSFIYLNKWTSLSPGKTVYLEKDNALSMTRVDTSTSSIFSQQIIYLLLFLLFYYIGFC